MAGRSNRLDWKRKKAMFNFGFGIGQSNRGLCVGDGRHSEDEGVLFLINPQRHSVGTMSFGELNFRV